MDRNALIEWCLEILEEVKYFERVRKLICPECNAEYGIIEKKIGRPPKLSCHKCDKELESIILGSPDVSVRGNITTVGQLAEANTKKLGRYGKEERDRQSEERHRKARRHVGLPDPEKAKRIDKINRMTPEQKQKYIHTGEGL